MANHKPLADTDRCPWATTPLGTIYHDTEWGRPTHDDRRLFEFLILEGAQAGLSWETILRRRDGYRRAFAEFDPVKVAKFDPRKVEKLMGDESIIRNRAKIESTIRNAKAFLKIQSEFGSFDAYLWAFVGGKPKINRWRIQKQAPASTPESDALSKDLRKRGFNFVGSTICYAYMQAMGLVNDHLVSCYLHPERSRE